MPRFLIHTCNLCLLLWSTIWKMLFSVNKQIYYLIFTYSKCPGLLCIMSYHSGTIQNLTLNSWIIFFKEILFCSVCLYKMFLPPLPPWSPFPVKTDRVSTEQATHNFGCYFSDVFLGRSRNMCKTEGMTKRMGNLNEGMSKRANNETKYLNSYVNYSHIFLFQLELMNFCRHRKCFGNR